MAEINDAFNNVTKEQSFFVPGKEKKEKFLILSFLMVKGIYLLIPYLLIQGHTI